MKILKFDIEKKYGKFKILNATNGGPQYKRHAADQFRSNFEDYKAARIPYARNHDSADSDIYGGPFSHDITCIFPNFDADENDPASYDFPCTDESILSCLETGTKTFFRLGQTIEHQIKKHNTLPPKDFKKWAVICEHIIRHYTEGWADGFYLDMPYWEIWNEPDLDPDDSTNKRTWGGTATQFFDLYEITAKHLKACFPNLKIGGPALAHDENWAEAFLAEMQKRNVKLDFFSWHIYTKFPEETVEQAERIRKMLDAHGYEKTESILNEWNYVRDWEEGFVYSLKTVHGLKGAAFTMSCICLSQPSSIDMLMYYDTRPSGFNGVFDYYTLEKLKGYWSLYWYGMFYDLENEVRAVNTIANTYSLCGLDKDGKITAIVACYSENDEDGGRQISIDFGRPGKFEIYAVDSEHDGEYIETTDAPVLNMERNSFVLIREV